MIIYNITFNIDNPIVDPWSQWLQKTYIPLHYDSGLITGHLFSEVQVQEELGGTTFSLQFFLPSELMYLNFIRMHADRIDAHLFENFGNQFVFFKTHMKLIEGNLPAAPKK